MLTIYQRTVKDAAFAEISDMRGGSFVIAERPNEEERIRLVQEGGFDEDLLKDAVDFYEAPRFEMKGGIAYFFTRAPYTSKDENTTTPLLIAVSPNAVLAVSLVSIPFFDEMKEDAPPIFTTQKSKLFLILISKNIASYQKQLSNIHRTARLGHERMEKISNKTILEFVAFERTLNEYIDALVPTNSALETILSGKYIEFYEKDNELVEDLSLAMEQLIRSAQATLKSMQNIRSAYATIVANNLNQVLKFLAALTVILTIPMVVSSFFGMNVQIPFAEHPLAFLGILGGTMLCVMLMAYVFAKKEWV